MARCALPALRPVHVRLESKGFAPVYAKNVTAAQGSTVSLGPFSLLPAFNVEGRVVTRDGQPIHNARVTLLPATAGEMTKSERLLRTLVATTGAKGNYRLHGVEPGAYRLVSAAEGFADAVIDNIAVADRDVRPPTLVHSGLSRVEVFLSPPVAPDNKPWSVHLSRMGMAQHENIRVSEGTAGPSGIWTSAPLQNGEYRIVVVGPNESEMANQRVVVDGRDERVTLAISGLFVRGRLLAADDGVPGKLLFTTRTGLRVEMVAGGDGRFGSVFPQAGSWALTVTTPPESSATVHLPNVDVRENMDELIVRLPGGRIDGVVRSPRGGPPEAIVTVRRDRKVVAQTQAGADGKFALTALDEAAYTIEAESKNGFAPAVEVDLSNEPRAEVELTLRERLQFKGVVVGPAGRPMSGAVVRTINVAAGEYEDTIADAEGLFALDERTIGPLDVIVIAPPAPVLARRLSPAQWQDQSVTLPLSPQSAILRIQMLRVPPWPVLTSSDGIARSLALFVMPAFGARGMREFVDGAFQFTIEPGIYRLCRNDDCRDLVLQPGAATTVNFVRAEERP
jgi:protocatechuate 3,4-dioxygenase beta subunit